MKQLLLKNKLAVAFSLLFVTAVLPLQSMAQKKVLFICNSAFAPGAGASTSEADPFIKELQADPTNFTVTTISTATGVTSVTKNGVANTTALEVTPGVAASSSPANIALFYANYDLLVTQESFGGTNAIWKAAGLLGIKNITIPVIYTKAFALQNTRAISDVAGTPTGNIAASVVLGSKLTITVPPANQANALFTGIDFSGGNDVAIFNALATDPGIAGTKAVDIAYNENITSVTTGDLASQIITQLALIDPAAGPVVGGAVPGTINPNSTLCVNDIPGGTYFGTAGDMLPTTSRMMLFAYNYGALAYGFSDGVSSNVTANGLKIFKNAALILTGTLGTNNNTLALDGISVSPNPTSGVITVDSTDAVKAITVFDVTGKQVSSSKTNTVDLSNQAKGVYLVNVQTEKNTTTKKVVVE